MIVLRVAHIERRLALGRRLYRASNIERDANGLEPLPYVEENGPGGCEPVVGGEGVLKALLHLFVHVLHLQNVHGESKMFYFQIIW